MRSIKQFCIIILFAFAYPVHATNEWIDIAENNSGDKWSIKAGSLEISKTKAGTPVAVVIGRIIGINENQVQLYKWYVPLKDCAQESGVVIALNISGEYKFENDFAFKSGNVASAMAESICGAASKRAENQRNKSL